MTTDADLCWKRVFSGRNPSRVLIVGSNVACSYIDDQGELGTPGRHRLVCLDLAGHERWSAHDFQLELVLRDGRLVGITRSGKLRVLDSNGRKRDGLRDGRKAVRCKDVVEVTEAEERILVLTQRELIVTDRELNVADKLPAPLQGRVVMTGDGAAYVAQKDKIVRWNSYGAAETLGCDSHPDHAATRTDFRSGRSVRDIA